MADIKLPARSLHIYYREENNLFGTIGQRGVRGSQSRSSSGQRGWWGNPCGFESEGLEPASGADELVQPTELFPFTGVVGGQFTPGDLPSAARHGKSE